MKDENSNTLVNKRWAEYFEGLLNVNDNNEVFISVEGNGGSMPVCERCNTEIDYDEIIV